MRVVLLCAAAALLAAGCNPTPATPPDSRVETKGESKKPDPPPTPKADTAPPEKAAEPWGTVRGRVTWAPKDLPDLPALKVTADVAHCASKGPIPNELWIVNKENRGVKNVVVWLVDASDPKKPKAPPIHPSLKEPKDKEVVIDQPCCKFEPRVVALRDSQVLVAKNSSPIAHNFNYAGGTVGDNKLIAAGDKWEIKLPAAEKPFLVNCNIHGWMRASVGVFNHPYFAVTDADGKFEIKDAPAGKYNIIMWHEDGGWVNGGKRGKPIEIKAGGVTEVNEGTRPAE
jgi:hypothetical protein